jgi:transposase
MQSLHRVRSRLVGMRTMLMNQLRAILLERGLAFPQGRRKFEVAVGVLLTDPETRIGARIRSLIAEIREEWAILDRRIEALDREFVEHARTDEAARRLVSIPGVGPMTATALRAAVDDGSAFARARDLPAWLGLVPRQHTTGGKPKLLGISKRGNAYLRQLFIHGARAALASLSKVEDATGRWLRDLLARAHYNVVVVALAAKLARIAWATLRKGGSFERRPEPALA